MASRLFAAMLFASVALAWLVAWVLIEAFLPNLEERGQFGDQFGAVNALFTGLAFAALVVTIYLQRADLSLQREELKLQRDEMRASREELANQSRVQKAQFLAALAQIRVAAVEAEIEAVKVEKDRLIPGAREQFVAQIREAGQRIEAIADQLERASGVG